MVVDDLPSYFAFIISSLSIPVTQTGSSILEVSLRRAKPLRLIAASFQGILLYFRRSGDRRLVTRIFLMTSFRVPFRQLSTYRPTMSSANWSRLIRFNPKSAPSTVLIGEPVDRELDVGLASYNSEEIKVNVYSGSTVLDAGQQTGKEEVVERILSPLARNEVGTIRCIGLNVSPAMMNPWLTLVPHPCSRNGYGNP
jgi:hypothetical protein